MKKLKKNKKTAEIEKAQKWQRMSYSEQPDYDEYFLIIKIGYKAMNPRNLTREDIEELNDIEPYCFETDREEQWFNVGLQYGLDVADANPKSPWISVEDDLPCNHEELLLSTGYHTVSVFTYKKGGSCGIDSMILRNGKWEWEVWKENYLYWMPIPKLPKEYEEFTTTSYRPKSFINI